MTYRPHIFSAFVCLAVISSCAAPSHSGGLPHWSSADFEKALAAPVRATPEIFAPGSISNGMYQRDSALSADGEHFLYTLQDGPNAGIVYVVKLNGVWQAPEFASFSGEWRDLEPAFMPGTLDLYFASARPLPGETEAGDFNLWRTEWQKGSWQDPVPLQGVNEDGNEFYPSLTQDGDIYFTATRDGGVGGEDIWIAKANGDGFDAPTQVGGGVNTAGDEFNAAVNADGSLLIFGSVRKGDPGGGDLYLSLKLDDGSWAPAQLLGQEINSARLDFCPFFGHDGTLWFTSSRRTEMPPMEGGMWDMYLQWQAAGNGLGDLYRVKLDQ